MITINIGDEFIGGSNQKVTVLKVDNQKEVILILFSGSGEPFVVTDSYTIKDDEIIWYGSRYRNTIDDALRCFNRIVLDK